MSTAAMKSFEDRGTLTEDIMTLNKTNGEIVNTPTVSVCSIVSCNTAQAGADPTTVEDCQHQEKFEELQENETSKEVADAVKTATESCVTSAGSQMSVWLNGSTSHDMKLVTPEQSDSEADDLRKECMTKLAKMSSISTDSHNGPRLLVHSEVVEESMKMVRECVVAVENDDSDDVTVLRISVTSPKTNHRETNCHAGSLASLRPDKSQKVTDYNSVDDISTSVTSLGSNKRCKRKRNKTAKPDASSHAMSLADSLARARSDISQESSTVNHVTGSQNCLKLDVDRKMTKNHICKSGNEVMSMASGEQQDSAASGCRAYNSARKTSPQSSEFSDGITKSTSQGSRGEFVGSHLPVKPSANNKGCDEVELGNSTLGCWLSDMSLHSVVSSGASSVIISKPPKPATINKACSYECTAVSAKSVESGCTSGDDSILFILHLLLQHFEICIY